MTYLRNILSIDKNCQKYILTLYCQRGKVLSQDTNPIINFIGNGIGIYSCQPWRQLVLGTAIGSKTRCV